MTHRKFISLILAAALAVTGMTAAPVQASDRDVAKWVAGAVATGLIGAAIADKRRDDRAVTRHQEAICRGSIMGTAAGMTGTTIAGTAAGMTAMAIAGVTARVLHCRSNVAATCGSVAVCCAAMVGTAC